MDRYEDLTFYADSHYEYALNIGWNVDRTKCPGDGDRQTADKLAAYLRHQVNMTRNAGIFRQYSYGGREYLLGTAELRIVVPGGPVYALPDIVIADIAEGYWQVPGYFKDALEAAYAPDSEEYAEYMGHYCEEDFWGAPADYVRRSRELYDRISEGNIHGVLEYIAAYPDAVDLITARGNAVNAAILSRQPEIAAVLIRAGADLGRLNGRELLSAIDMGMPEIARLLLDEGVTVNTYTIALNPLFYAVFRMQNAIAQTLFDERKDMVCVYTNHVVKDCNILQWALRCDNRGMLEYMSSRGIY